MLSAVGKRMLMTSVAFLVPFLVVSGLASAGAIEVVQDNVMVQPEDRPTRTDRLTERYGCSPFGLPDGQEPVHAIVRDPGATGVHLASFAEGWEMYAGDRPGTLMAVCAR